MLLFSDSVTLIVQRKCHPMNTQVTLTMKEQHKLKIIVDYESGIVPAQRAAKQLSAVTGVRQLRLLFYPRCPGLSHDLANLP